MTMEEKIEALSPEARKTLEQITKRGNEIQAKSNLMWAFIEIAESLEASIKNDTIKTTTDQINFLTSVLIALERKDLIKIK